MLMLLISLLLLTELFAVDSLLLSCADVDALGGCALLAPASADTALLSASAAVRRVSSTAVASVLDAAGFSASFIATPDGDCFTLLHAFSDGGSELSGSDPTLLLLLLLISCLEALPSANVAWCSEVLLCMAPLPF